MVSKVVASQGGLVTVVLGNLTRLGLGSTDLPNRSTEVVRKQGEFNSERLSTSQPTKMVSVSLTHSGWLPVGLELFILYFFF